MKSTLLFLIIIINYIQLNAQTTTVNIGTTAGPFDSSYVIQTGTTDSFHPGNHPGAGAYMNGEIYLCQGATLKHNFPPGTSSNPVFYLEENTTLKLSGQLFSATVYMKNGATLDGDGSVQYLFIKRVSTSNVINMGAGSNNMDSIFNNINYTFTTWPGSVSPCNTPNSLSNENSFSINIYPNPAFNFIKLSNTSSQFVISDIQGKIILENKNFNSDIVNISSLKEGMYFIQWQINGINYASKFLKM